MLKLLSCTVITCNICFVLIWVLTWFLLFYLRMRSINFTTLCSFPSTVWLLGEIQICLFILPSLKQLMFLMAIFIDSQTWTSTLMTVFPLSSNSSMACVKPGKFPVLFTWRAFCSLEQCEQARKVREGRVEKMNLHSALASGSFWPSVTFESCLSMTDSMSSVFPTLCLSFHF